MAEHELDLTIDKGFDDEAKAFFHFLRQAGRRHPVVFSVRRVTEGKYHAIMTAAPETKIDAFLQELMMSRALYYYACGIKNRHTVTAKVIAPLFQHLLESRFAFIYHRYLRLHIMGLLSEEMVPSDLADPFAHKYEVLFRKWDLQMITDYDFVRDLDDLLTDFMLTNLGHAIGKKSGHFDMLVGQCGSANVILRKETRKAFTRVHDLRTRGLHRLEKTLDRSEISMLAIEIHLYFQYFDEFMESQAVKTMMLKGKRYRRLKYGDEEVKYKRRPDLKGAATDREWADSSIPCHDCDAIKGQYHCDHCDMERCPRCFNQLLSCGCTWDDDGGERSRRVFGQKNLPHEASFVPVE